MPFDWLQEQLFVTCARSLVVAETVYRLYREKGLTLRTKQPRRRKMVVYRQARCRPDRPNEAWSPDFVHDQLSNGQQFRGLTVVDVFSREALAIDVGQRLPGEDVIEVLSRLVRLRGAPKYLFADDGAEFAGHLIELWAYHHGVRIDFSRRGKPMDNAHIETFNGSLRDECLSVHWFASLAEAKRLIEAWGREYNDSRPHRALGNLMPAEYPARSGHCPIRIGPVGI
ncbi:MAG: IS3 family transposase [Novosphingobium sp.]|nr:IS3 family transposase [Novosphingobium sp.]MCP5400918.1 IS3 family transposase [Novosphingobium sp.]